MLAEACVYNLGYGWAGTLDMVVDLPDGSRALLDFKTSKGVYADTGPSSPPTATAPTTSATTASRTRCRRSTGAASSTSAPTGTTYPIRADEHVLKQMRYVAAVARAVDEMDSWKLPALSAPQPTLDLG